MNDREFNILMATNKIVGSAIGYRFKDINQESLREIITKTLSELIEKESPEAATNS